MLTDTLKSAVVWLSTLAAFAVLVYTLTTWLGGAA